MGITNIGLGQIDTIDMTTVPNVIGNTIAVATSAITASNLTVSATNTETDTSNALLGGIIISTTPLAGTLVDTNSEVSYDAYKYVAPYSFTPAFGFSPPFGFTPQPPPAPFSFTPYSFAPRFR